MNIAIVGLGKFGKEVTKTLVAENHDITVIDTLSTVVDDVVNEYDIQGYVGNGASYETLKEISIDKYDLLIATTQLDELNILISLIAKKMGVKQTICRVRNPEYQVESRQILSELGINHVLNPDLDTAREIYRILRFPSAIKVQPFGEGRVDLIEFRVEAKSLLNGLSLFDLGYKYGAKILVCAVQRNKQVIIPKGDFVLMENDFVYVTAANEELERSFKKLKLFKSAITSVMIVGASKITYYLTDLLTKSGFSVKVIESDKQIAKDFATKNPSAMVFYADGTNQNLLLSEGLADGAFISLTGSDETNIILSSFANSIQCKKVITKFSNTNYESMVANIGLDSYVTPKHVFASNTLRYVRGYENKTSNKCKTLYRLVDNRVEALEFLVSEKTNYTSVPLKNIKIKPNYLLAAIIRGGEVIIPSGNDTIENQDSVIIVTNQANTKDIGDIFE